MCFICVRAVFYPLPVSGGNSSLNKAEFSRSNTGFNSVILVGSRSDYDSVFHVVRHSDMDCVCRLREEVAAEGNCLFDFPVLTRHSARFKPAISVAVLACKDHSIFFQNGLVGIVPRVRAPDAGFSTSSSPNIFMFSANIRTASETCPVCYSVCTGGSFTVCTAAL